MKKAIKSTCLFLLALSLIITALPINAEALTLSDLGLKKKENPSELIDSEDMPDGDYVGFEEEINIGEIDITDVDENYIKIIEEDESAAEEAVSEAAEEAPAEEPTETDAAETEATDNANSNRPAGATEGEADNQSAGDDVAQPVNPTQSTGISYETNFSVSETYSVKKDVGDTSTAPGNDTDTSDVGSLSDANRAENIRNSEGVDEDTDHTESNDPEFVPLTGAELVLENYYATDSETAYWDQFESKYYYNKLNSEEKTLYRKLYDQAMGYLTGTDTFKVNSSYPQYFGMMPAVGLTINQAMRVVRLFVDANPQFYFIAGSGYLYGTQDDVAYISTNFYADYKRGAARTEATSTIKAKADGWLPQIRALNGEREKFEKIYQIVCRHATYCAVVSQHQSGANAHTMAHQSSATALLTGETVCAGYAEMFEFLAKGAGLECIVVTSPGHEWNEVCINGTWYHVDATWGDNPNYIDWYFFGKDDTNIRAYDGNGSESHVTEDIYSGLSPTCSNNLNYNPRYTQLGKVFHVTYVLGGGTNDARNLEQYAVSGSSYPLYSPTKSGYKFDGWYLNNKTKVTSLSSAGTDIILYARWRDTYKVRWSANGGEPKTIYVSPCKYGTRYKMRDNTTSANPFTKAHYDLAGWNTRADGKGINYSLNGTFSFSETSDVDEITFYAMWKPSPYNIIYEGLEGANNSNNKTIYDIETSVTLQPPVGSPVGKTFVGWYSNAALTKPITSVAKGTGDKRVYAKWKTSKLTLRFDKNDDDGDAVNKVTGTKASVNIEYQKSASVGEKEGYYRPYYRFNGWNTQKDGTGDPYQNGDEYFNNETVSGDDQRTLYAQWTPIERAYYLVCHGNGATSSKYGTLERTVNANELVPACPFEKKGYDFIGWSTVADDKEHLFKPQTASDASEPYPGDMISAVVSDTPSDDTVVLYAQWKPCTYAITYEGLGTSTAESVYTSGMTDPVESYTILEKVYLQNDLKKDGYVFAGWYKDATFKTKVTSIAKGTTGNQTFYAKWTPRKYTIRFDANDGVYGEKASGKMSDVKGVAFNKKITLPANAYKMEGKQFYGWSPFPVYTTDPNQAPITNKGRISIEKDICDLVQVPGEDSSVITLYAQWRDPIYTITYKNVTDTDGNGNAASLMDEYGPGSVKCNLAAGGQINLYPLTRNGYIFGGWYKDAAFTKPVNKENLKGPLDVLADDITGNQTFYAKWTKRKYKIQFVGGMSDETYPVTGSTKAVTVTYGSAVTLPANGFKRPYYTFAGWKIENNDNANKGELIKNKLPIKASDALRLELEPACNEDNTETPVVTLQAQWIPTEYKINYKNVLATDVGLNPAIGATYNKFSPAVSLSVPSRDGFDFGGWYTDSKLKKPVEDTANAIPTGSSGTKTFYAKWTPHKYNIQFVSGNTPDIRKQVTKTMKPLNGRNCGTKYTLTANAYKRTGYAFAGWKMAVQSEGNWAEMNVAGSGVTADNANYVSDTYDANALAQDIKNKKLLDKKKKVTHADLGIAHSDINATVVLVAQWTPVVYKVTYKNMMQETSGIKADITTTYTCEDDDTIHPNPTRVGYTFVGWYTDTKFKKASDRIAAGSTGNKTYYAKWVKQ